VSSIIAVRVYTGENSCIYFGTDQQETTYEGDKAVAKRTAQKIWAGQNWILAHAGTVTEHLDEFRKRLQGRKKVGSEEWGLKKAGEMISRAVT